VDQHFKKRMTNKSKILAIATLVWLLGVSAPGLNSITYVSAFNAPATFVVSARVKQNAQSALFSQGNDIGSSKSVRRKLSRLLRLPEISIPTRQTMKRKHISKATASLALSLSILLKAPNSAMAALPMGVDTPVYLAPGNDKMSLRPGITREQIDVELKNREEMAVGESINPTSDTSREDADEGDTITSKKKDSTDGFDDDYEFDEDEDESEASIFSSDVPSLSSSNVMDIGASSSSKTVQRFSGSEPELTKEAEDVLIQKTVVKIIGPIFAFCFARETIRWRMEQNNVNKGIEIMEQQRQEYLNSKKDDEDDDDEDDDDDDDDEDDDEDDDDE